MRTVVFHRCPPHALLLGLIFTVTPACSRPAAPAKQAAANPASGQSSAGSSTNSDDVTTAETFDYPQARRGDQADDYHGTQVADPYRWLEDPDSPETRAWIEAENKITFGFLEKIPERERLRQRLTELWNYEKFGVPSQRGGRYFYTRNDGLQNQSVLYWAPSLEAEPKLLLDPNALSAEGTIAVSGTAVSDDGKHLAYGLATAGSDWQEWRVRDVESGADLDDHLKWVKFSGASWSHDGQGFYYSRYDEPAEGEQLTGQNYFQKLYYHKVGTPQSDDRLVYERRDEKEWGFHGQATDDGRWLVITVTHGTERKNNLFYLDLAKPDAEVVELLTGFEARYEFIDNDGDVFWVRTDLDAPRNRIVAIDVTQPDRESWKEIVAEADDVLEAVSVVGDRFFAIYLKDASSQVRMFALPGDDGAPDDDWVGLGLPGIGTAAGFTGRRGDKETFYSFTSFTTPTTIYRYDLAEERSEGFRRPKVGFEPDDYETEQVFYESKDGTRVPMFLTHRKGQKPNPQTPTYLYGYGGFDISLSPSFSVGRLVWLEMGGLYAMPSLRGGGEYGRAWHEAGMKDKKQNVFDDFIAAAEWLIDHGYTSREKLAISGRSNGGLLVGACLTQRPELYGAALPGVGVMDMLRFHKFTIGWAWALEYGSSDDAEHFKTLHAYSPLHNLKPGTHYPPTLITTADHDDRVVPAHSFKFAATLQAAQAGPAPVLIRIETSAGHGAGLPTSKAIEELADSYAFLVKVLGIETPKGE
ncbi:MAG TPA: prolyl oligopeptidase family serine peptidase [Pirellulales bacterium]|nr:prolyl oligopeptidase family serine peptidase [Pirellulales bacterium]